MPQERSRSIQYINRLRILSIYAVVTAHVTIWLTMASDPSTFSRWSMSQLSLLRPLSELLIEKILVERYPKLQAHQLSDDALFLG